MTRYDDEWVERLAAPHRIADDVDQAAVTSLVYVITDTDDGKIAFNLHLAADAVTAAGSGKLPRGVKPDVTITIKEPHAFAIWSGARTRDAAFMAGDIKVEGRYEVWIDHVVSAFEQDAWAGSWAAAAG